MRKYNYLVTVFSDGKHIHSYYSYDLDDLVTIKAMHKGCEIRIQDLQEFKQLTKEQVEAETRKSYERWKKSLERVVAVSQPRNERKEKPKKEKLNKFWERPVRCVETGMVYATMRECSKRTGIPYMTIVNCVKRKNATRGLHFVDAR